MTTIPEGAERSEDGQWWWDGNDWQPVGPDGGGEDGLTAEFAFDGNGLLVSPDETDNPDNHAILHHEAGTQVSFVVWNVGQVRGAATVTVYVDDREVQTWVSGEVEPGGSVSPDNGFVHGCGRYDAGHHVFRALVTPGHAGNDSAYNGIDIE